MNVSQFPACVFVVAVSTLSVHTPVTVTRDSDVIYRPVSVKVCLYVCTLHFITLRLIYIEKCRNTSVTSQTTLIVQSLCLRLKPGWQEVGSVTKNWVCILASSGYVILHVSGLCQTVCMYVCRYRRVCWRCCRWHCRWSMFSRLSVHQHRRQLSLPETLCDVIRWPLPAVWRSWALSTNTIRSTSRSVYLSVCLHCVSKMHQLWNGIAQNYNDRFKGGAFFETQCICGICGISPVQYTWCICMLWKSVGCLYAAVYS